MQSGALAVAEVQRGRPGAQAPRVTFLVATEKAGTCLLIERASIVASSDTQRVSSVTILQLRVQNFAVSDNFAEPHCPEPFAK